ncbi:autotransporter outer membrane beta-barrel domain-containing protein [Burkholderia sp. BCC0405]|uniref:autotransporter family protein n=1 Tax=Burkholderia sp. BCC0405 TaxID=2676298 RepID=UPI001FC83CDF|nr:autotransporter outer membrane beta-barrel domain-containing protein [Burkholderia sp. BCC0405]
MDTGITFTNGFAITGGAGGSGSANGSGNRSGDGGAGGAGVTGSSFSLVNSGTIQGGDGGAAGGTGSAPGVGGAGVIGSDLTIVNSGTIAGGLSSDGATRANAIAFTGGQNSLELDAGYSVTGVVSNAPGASATNTLILGGNTTPADAFDVSQIAPAGSTTQQFQDFTAFQKSGSSTWTLTGTTSAVTPWTIEGGTLQVSEDDNLGAATGALTFNGGALNTTSSFTTERAILLDAGGGTLDVDSSTTLTTNGVISGSGALNKAGAGTLVLMTPATYTGDTTVAAGVLQAGAANVLSPVSATTVASNATLDLNGFNQTLSSLNNAGTVKLGTAATVGTALTVQGNYVGNNGQVVLNTVLGGDSSATDKLVIDGGHASGSSALVIHNAGGSGAQTTQGIRVVETINGGTTDPTAFSLSNASDGYRTGVGTIVAGAYDYSLTRGGVDGVANDWYLTSVGNQCSNNSALCPTQTPSATLPLPTAVQPLVRPEVGAYLNNRLFAQTMQFHTLHDRQSETSGTVSQDPSQAHDNSAWVRVVGKTSSRTGANGMDLADTDYMVHVGGDVWRTSDGRDGSVRLGVMGAYGSSGNRASNGVLGARGTVDGYNAGLYGTWYGNKDILTGPYVDSWMMAGIFQNKVSGQGLPSETYNSRNLAASVEAGYSFPVHDDGKARLFVVPQAQVIVSNYHANTHTEQNGTVVSGQSGTSVTTRVGVRLSGEVKDDAGVRQVRPFAEANWWHGPASQSISFDGVAIRDALPANRFEGKFGVQGNVTKALSLWGTVGFEVGGQGYVAGQAQAGMKYAW